MRMWRGLALCALLLASPAWADDDLDRIPPVASVAPPAPSTTGSRTLYLQGDFALFAKRSALAVPLPDASAPSWEARLFADARITWPLGETVSLVYSGRLNLRAESDLPFPAHQDIRHDFREGYVAWQAGEGLFLEFGRINLKSGVALGFNPTDFFKSRAVVEPLSADPSVLREDRLGTLMLLGQRVWNGASLTLAIAPKIAAPSAIYANGGLPSFNPVFDRTNARSRILIKASATLFDDVSPEFLLYNEAGRTSFGLNLTRSFGRSVVGYVEWAGGSRAGLVHEALAYGKLTGSLPPGAPSILADDPARAFRNDLALGAAYASDFGLSLNLEYHFHQAGFSGADWRDWFAGGSGGDPLARATLWYIRGYANDGQEPVARHALFLRAAWTDAFVRDLSLSGFADVDLRDGSGIAQLAADYYLSRDWTAGALVDASFGGKRSDFGSLPGSGSVLIKLSRYF